MAVRVPQPVIPLLFLLSAHAAGLSVTLHQSQRFCLAQDDVYEEFGALCSDAIDGSFDANISGSVSTSAPGSYQVTYICNNSRLEVATATRSVVVTSSLLPGDLHLQYVQLQTSRAGGYVAAGTGSVLTNVNPKTDVRLVFSVAFSLNTEECRFARIVQSGTGTTVLEVESTHSDLVVNGLELTLPQELIANLSSGLQELTSYAVVLEEHFASAASGGGGSLRQSFSFSTGDYSTPTVTATSPAAGDLAVGLQQVLMLTLSENVQLGENESSLVITEVESNVSEQVPCNGSASSAGLQLLVSGQAASVAKAGWKSCADYSVAVEAGCFVDGSMNGNPSAALPAFQFATSCVTSTSPTEGSTAVAVRAPLNITFAHDVRLGAGDISVRPLGEAPLLLNANHYPLVYSVGPTLTLDLACQTDRCRVFSAYQEYLVANDTENATVAPGLNATLGLCAGWPVQQCRGKVFTVSWGADALVFANRSWPAGSLLGGSATVPAEPSALTFSLAEADFTAPEVLYLRAEATARNSVEVEAHVSEGGAVHCAAFRDWGDSECTSLELSQEVSQGRCNASQAFDDCLNCGGAAYGCFNRTTMWADDGCAGSFLLQGRKLVCESWEREETLYDGGARAVLSLGWRHGCAVTREASPLLKCWGKADHIDPTTSAPPTSSFTAVAAGYQHSCGILAGTGAVSCWGNDMNGETVLPANASGAAFRSVSCGYRFSCGLRDDTSNAVCWGLDDVGQVTQAPTDVQLFAVSAGSRHACGLRLDDHSALCWGWDSYGQSTPPAGVRFAAHGAGGALLAEASISAGWYHTCAVVEVTGNVLCWGSDADGQSSVPADGGAFVQVAAGRAHTCGLQKTLDGRGLLVNGTVRCWGLNNAGQASPPASLAFSTLAADDDYTCGIGLLDHALYCWGEDEYARTTPAPGTFGVLDEFVNVTCSLDDRPTSEEVMGLSGARDAGAAQTVSRSGTAGYAGAKLELTGLLPLVPYWVYCTAEDDEVPEANRIGDLEMFRRRLRVVLPDTQQVSVLATKAAAVSGTEVLVTLSLSQPREAGCLPVRDQAKAPSALDIAMRGVWSVHGPELAPNVTLAGLQPDTEYDIYCFAKDKAGGLLLRELASVAAMGKGDVHTLV